MTNGYLYRNDNLNALRAQAGDPWLRARRIRVVPENFPHHQLGRALQHAKPGEGVFRLSIWRDLQCAMTDLRTQLLSTQVGALNPDGPLILQRIRADHPMFSRYERGDDQYLSGQAWLFWRTEACTETQDWSADGISHDDIEVFHPSGRWMPYAQWVTTRDAPPPVEPGWTRIELPPASEGDPKRYMDARWVELPSGRGRGARGLFGRVPTWSPAVWPSNWETLQMLTQRLVNAFPKFVHEGHLVIALERTDFTQTFDVTVVRRSARRASWFRRTFCSDPGTPASVSLTDAELKSPASIEAFLSGAGLDSQSLGPNAFVYTQASLDHLDGEVAAVAHRSPEADAPTGGRSTPAA